MKTLTKETKPGGDRVLSPGASTLLVVLSAFTWLIWPLTERHVEAADFSIFYTAVKLIIQGDRTHLFNMQAQAEFQQRVLGTDSLLPFNHLAYESLLFIPLGYLSFTCALWIWRAVSAVMLLASVSFLAKVFRAARRDVLLLSLSFFPVTASFMNGQDSMLLMILLSGCLAALKRNRDQLAGALLAAALFKPHLVLPFAIFLMWNRRTRFIQGFLGCGVAIALVSTVLTGVNGWREMVHLMRYAALGGSTEAISGLPHLEPNVRGVLVLSGMSVHSAFVVSVLISALLYLVVAWALRNQQAPELLFAPLAALTLLVCVHINVHDVSILLIPIIAMAAQRRMPTSICVAICLSQPLFLATNCASLFAFIILVALILTARNALWQQTETELNLARAASLP